MQTPFFPPWRPQLAPLRSRFRQTIQSWRRATLAQIEQTFGPALPSDLLLKPTQGPHSRRRVFCLQRRPLSRPGVVQVVLQTVAPGNVSGRFENHPGHGTAKLSHPSHGSKRTAGLLHRSSLAPRDHGPSGGNGQHALGTDQLQRHARCLSPMVPDVAASPRARQSS